MIRIEIHVDQTSANRISTVRRIFRSRIAKLSLAALLLGLPVAAIASPVSTLNTFEAGQPISASEINDNFTALETSVNDNDTRVSSMEQSVAYGAAAGQFITQGTPTIVQYDVLVHDQSTPLVTTGANWAFTPTESGKYFIVASAALAGGGVTMAFYMSILKNGVSTIGGAASPASADSFTGHLQTIGVVDVAAGDAIEVEVIHSGTGPFELIPGASQFVAIRIGD